MSWLATADQSFRKGVNLPVFSNQEVHSHEVDNAAGPPAGAAFPQGAWTAFAACLWTTLSSAAIRALLPTRRNARAFVSRHPEARRKDADPRLALPRDKERHGHAPRGWRRGRGGCNAHRLMMQSARGVVVARRNTKSLRVGQR